MPFFRVLIVSSLISGVLTSLIRAYIFDSYAVSLILGVWLAMGMLRVFSNGLVAPTFQLAFKGVLMSLAWPLVPKRN